MAIATGLINTLRRYGASSDANKAQLETWFHEAIEEIAQNKGGDVVSGSANGASFSQMANMTVAEWMTALDRAIYMIDNNVTSLGRSFGRT
jgi:hypothetical protein